MDLSLSEDQLALLAEIEKLAAPYQSSPVDFHGFALFSEELERALEEAQYYEIAAYPEMGGAVSAALVVERLARLPWTAEVALSMLVRPHLAPDSPRPWGIVENGRPGRFVARARTLLVVEGERVGLAQPRPEQLEALPDSLYAYPMGRLAGEVAVDWLDAEGAERARTWLRVACAAEMAGLLRAAIDLTVEHLSTRKQFGRPLGTFQALRHRLAECEVLAGGTRWLALKAAASGDPGDAALAAHHAQDAATRTAYDVHQMCGAMGMTLEMDLHLWTYRMKALLSELGGRAGQAEAVAAHWFGTG
ncbi:MAG: hypothetical protein KatS3mg124_1784 [Porticoccaceae bacterium]|nr:MAG: hypothetical protein KatS3mg124_1784 [Porticoccaceae bacterium]